MRRRPKEISKMIKREKFWKKEQARLDDIGVKTPGKQMSKYRFRKLHPQDCGRPRCGVCSRHKRFGEASAKDLIADDQEKDQRKEAFGS